MYVCVCVCRNFLRMVIKEMLAFFIDQTTSMGQCWAFRHTHSTRCLSHIPVARSTDDTQICRSTLDCGMVLSRGLFPLYALLFGPVHICEVLGIEWHWRFERCVRPAEGRHWTSGSHLGYDEPSNLCNLTICKMSAFVNVIIGV